MHNAAASLDSDFGVQAAPRRKPTSPKAGAARPGPSKSRKTAAKAGRARGALFDKMPRYGAIAISVLIGVGIVVNALMMQHGHHPAPLFGSTAPDRSVATKVAPAKPLSKAEVQDAAPVMAAVEAAEAPVRPAARPAATRTAHGDDPIARLLGGDASRKARSASEKVAMDKTSSGKGGTARPVGGHDGQSRRRARED